MYSNDRYRIPESSPGRRYSDQRISSGGRQIPPDPRDTVRPQSRRSLESDRRGLEVDRRESRDRIESIGRRSQNFDYNHGHQPERRDFERNRMEDEGKRKMAEELKIREQQLAITSNLLQKQSEMLKNMEANIMTRNRPGPSPMMGRNMGPPGPNMGPMNMRPNPRTRSPRRSFEFNNDMDKGRYDGPPPKRFKAIEQDERSNWKNAVQTRGSMSRAGGHMKGGPVADKCIICKSSNHVARFCPKATKGLDGNGPSPDNVCNHCQSPKHFARDCPNNVRIDNGKVCNICSSPHHFMRNCPQNSSKDQFSGPKRDDKRTSVGGNKPYGTTSRFGGTRGGRRPFKSDRFRRKFAGNSNIKSCKVCSLSGVGDFETHMKTPEHTKMFELCKTGCKLCSKKRYNSKPQYDKHQISTLHKALVSKKKLVVEAKLKPYSSSNTSGVEYVVPVSGFFCKLCKKFYNKESYAKVDHCKTKPHYDKVAAMIGSKFETAIGARFQGIKDKLSAEVKDQTQLERKLIEAVRKADFVTDLKPIPGEAKKTLVPKAPAATSAQTTTEADKPAETIDKPAEIKPADTTEAQEEERIKTEETSENTKDAEEESEEKPVEDDGDHEHPDDLEMEVLDDAGGDDGAGAD